MLHRWQKIYSKLLKRILDVGRQCWLSHTELCGVHLCLRLMYSAESGVPPPVKSWKQQMKSLFIALLLPQSVYREIKWWWPTKHLWRGWKRDLRTVAFDTLRHTPTKKIHQSIQAWLYIHKLIWEPSGSKHACMCLRMHVLACVHTHSTVFFSMLVSLSCFTGFSSLSLSFWGSEKKC